MKKIYTLYSDPSHGWLRVPHADVVQAGVSVTTCSYRSNKYAYLEEDCDASAFMQGAEAKGWDVTVLYKYSDSPSHIRRKASY